MTDDEARRRVAAAPVGRLASIDARGRPHVVPVCFALSGDRIFSVVDHKPKRTLELRRLDNVRRNPAVQLVVDRYDDDWSRLAWVQVLGRVAVEDAVDPGALAALAARYPAYRERAPRGPLLRLRPERVLTWRASAS
jgi:PPOX class probable F420-dependent enzyme